MSTRRTWVKGPRFTAAAVGLVGLAVAAASAVGGSTAVAAPAADPTTIEYVALGDSYSAGPLIPVVVDLACVRSSNNYPAILRRTLEFASITDVTCSGARTTDMREPQTGVTGIPAAPQYDALTPTTDLVTIGIGGNDYGLFGSMLDTCPAVAADHPRGKPCKQAFTTPQGVDKKLRDAKRIGRRVGRVVREVQEISPEATILVVGYPRLLPVLEKGEQPCAQAPFARGDYQWANRVERTLNRSMSTAARAEGASFVGLYPSTRGHDICAGRAAWINGKDNDVLRGAASYHPFLAGMENAAEQVHQKLITLGLAG
jgi:hypothetical protein